MSLLEQAKALQPSDADVLNQAMKSVLTRMDGRLVLVNIDDGTGQLQPYLLYDAVGLSKAVEEWAAYYHCEDDPKWFTDWMEERGFSFALFYVIEV